MQMNMKPLLLEISFRFIPQIYTYRALYANTREQFRGECSASLLLQFRRFPMDILTLVSGSSFDTLP